MAETMNILHQTYRGFGFVGLGMEIENRIGVCSLGLQTFVAAFVVFILCVTLDSFRRCAVLVFARGRVKK